MLIYSNSFNTSRLKEYFFRYLYIIVTKLT